MFKLNMDAIRQIANDYRLTANPATPATPGLESAAILSHDISQLAKLAISHRSAEAARDAPAPDTLTWLRACLGTDTVPLTSIREAAARDGVRWRLILMLKDDHVLEQTNMYGTYWKLPHRIH